MWHCRGSKHILAPPTCFRGSRPQPPRSSYAPAPRRPNNVIWRHASRTAHLQVQGRQESRLLPVCQARRGVLSGHESAVSSTWVAGLRRSRSCRPPRCRKILLLLRRRSNSGRCRGPSVCSSVYPCRTARRMPGCFSAWDCEHRLTSLAREKLPPSLG